MLGIYNESAMTTVFIFIPVLTPVLTCPGRPEISLFQEQLAVCASTLPENFMNGQAASQQTRLPLWSIFRDLWIMAEYPL